MANSDQQIILPPNSDYPSPRQPWYDSLPVWLKAALLIGPTALIALGLTYRIPVQIDSLTVKVEAHAASQQIMAQEFIIYKEAVNKGLEELLRINRQMCVNTAKNDEQRLKCF